MRYSFLLFFILALTSSSITKGQDLSKKEFTEKYYNAAVKFFPDVKYSIVGDLELLSGKEGEYKHFLHNAYAEYKNAPADVDSVILRYIKSTRELYSEKSLDINRIVPVIKDKGYINDINKSAGDKAKSIDLVYQEYNAELIIVFAEDNETGIRYFSKDELAKTKIPRDSLLPKAISNLEKILAEIQVVGDNGNFGLVAGGTYEASLILLQSLWTKENFDVKGDIIISIPTRDLLLITGSKDKKGMETIAKSTKEAYESGSYYLTPELFIWKGKKFVKYNK